MTPAEAERLILGAKAVGVQLDTSAVGRLGRFLDAFTVWNRRTRLTGERDLPGVIDNHVVDSLALTSEVRADGFLIDIGTGAGFPGIVLACLRPDLPVALIESRRRPVSFLREAIRAIPLPRAQALEMRAETAAQHAMLSHRGAIVTARAVRLDVFLTLAIPLLAPGGRAVAMQTPRTARLAPAVATAHGLAVERRHDYVLPRGAPRSLLVFTRRGEAVS